MSDDYTPCAGGCWDEMKAAQQERQEQVTAHVAARIQAENETTPSEAEVRERTSPNFVVEKPVEAPVAPVEALEAAEAPAEPIEAPEAVEEPVADEPVLEVVKEAEPVKAAAKKTPAAKKAAADK